LNYGPISAFLLDEMGYFFNIPLTFAAARIKPKLFWTRN